ncbi:MAG: arginine--tRNA ligase, partial [Lutibacter sp.]|nr:arginine--tRNA ligase [Lutibacter sp.]
MQHILEKAVQKALEVQYDVQVETLEFQATRKDFEGDITLVIFPLLRHIKGNPVEIGNNIGAYLKAQVDAVTDFNVIKGFLNLVIADAYYRKRFAEINQLTDYGKTEPKTTDKAVMVEYSSPNTNKPLHLGHIRNNLLGYSVAEIIKAAGKKVYKTQIINDRGIHICKSMLAWQRFGKGETPETSGLKGDQFVGKFYVAFDKAYKEEIKGLTTKGHPEEMAKKEAPILLEAQQMLRQWEAGDPAVVALWKKMNQWVYDGFNETYKELGVDFDKHYYESDTYLLGKDHIAEGLKKGVFYTKEDGSVWIDLSEEGLDEKIVLRADGTAVYMTQDIGTAIERFK